MPRFFIDRPVFAWVLAILTILAGVAGITTLPVSQYPEVSPPTVRVQATYNGASASAVQNSVTSVIEEALTGLDGMLYMESSSSRGSASVTIVFDQSIDPNDAQVEVQNNISSVTSRLPQTVQDQGVRVRRSTSSILLVGALVSDNNSYSSLQLADIFEKSMEGAVERTSGVGSIRVFGSGYAMRIWLDPYLLAKYALTPADVTSAIEAQNTNVAVGTLGANPAVPGQQITVDITAQSQLVSVDDFRAILLKTDNDGAAVRLGDVARVEIGQETYGGNSRLNGQNAAGFGVSLASGANAVDTARAVRETIAGIEGSLPNGVRVEYAYDTSPFVEKSIYSVVETIVIAIILVTLVLFTFLHNWRSTIVPTIAVPIVLMGTFGVLAIAGYSINTLTMFAMVLAIGMLVDDAIVVVENVQRLMQTQHLDPREATRKSMAQISSALVGTTVVIVSVFMPMAFFGGSTGIIYRQFSLTIIAAMVLSTLVALILTPAMCASMLRPAAADPGQTKRSVLRSLFNGFDHYFGRLHQWYTGVVARLLRRAWLSLVLLALVVVGIVVLFRVIPGSFLPQEDQGVLMVSIRLPERSTTPQTLAVVKQVEAYLLEKENAAVAQTFASLGFGFSGTAQNSAMVFAKLQPFEERNGNADLAASAVAARANRHFMGTNRMGNVFVLQPPAIHGMGNTGGFSMYLVDQAGNGQQALVKAASEVATSVGSDSRVMSVRGHEQQTRVGMRLNIDQQKAASFGISLTEINAMLSVIFSGREVNDFELDANLRPVIVQGDAPFRMQPGDINYWHARNSAGEMVPFAAFTSTSWESVPASLDRYGATRAISLSGSPAPGVSSGDAMLAMEEAVAKIGGYGVAWTGMSYQERLSGSQAPLLYAISILVVFLALAALYESWSIPLAILLVVPVGVLGALVGAVALDQSNDVYFKVGMLATIGLAAKNAILIVEFAVELQREGLSLLDSLVKASEQRFRPILMTSLTFILGVTPLALASGAGAGAQNAIGTAVLFGMIAATFVGVFIIPLLLWCVQKLFRVSFHNAPTAS